MPPAPGGAKPVPGKPPVAKPPPSGVSESKPPLSIPRKRADSKASELLPDIQNRTSASINDRLKPKSFHQMQHTQNFDQNGGALSGRKRDSHGISELDMSSVRHASEHASTKRHDPRLPKSFLQNG